MFSNVSSTKTATASSLALNGDYKYGGSSLADGANDLFRFLALSNIFVRNWKRFEEEKGEDSIWRQFVASSIHHRELQCELGAKTMLPYIYETSPEQSHGDVQIREQTQCKHPRERERKRV